MKKLFSSLLMLVIAMTAMSQESQTTYNFLRLPVSAHAAALGGDNISIIEDDPALVFSNPALLASVSDKMLGLNYMNYMSGVNMVSASFSRVAKEKLSWAAGAQYINYGTMKETSADGTITGEFSAKDIALSGHLSYMLFNRLSGGITARIITSYLGDYNSLAVGVDLGLNYYDPDREISVSAVAKNLGGQVKAYDDDYERIPVDVIIGASKQFSALPVRISATLSDLNHWDYSLKDHLNIGAEILLSQSIWIGAGYNFRRAHEAEIDTGNEDTTSAHGAGWSFGAGINLERFHLNLAYGKYHVSSSSININVAYAL